MNRDFREATYFHNNRILAYTVIFFEFLLIVLLVGFVFLFVKADGCGLSAAYGQFKVMAIDPFL